MIFVVTDSSLVTSCTFWADFAVIDGSGHDFSVVRTLRALLGHVLASRAVVTRGTLVEVGCGDTDDAVVPFDTVHTVIRSFGSWQRILAFFASCGQLRSL